MAPHGALLISVVQRGNILRSLGVGIVRMSEPSWTMYVSYVRPYQRTRGICGRVVRSAPHLPSSVVCGVRSESARLITTLSIRR